MVVPWALAGLIDVQDVLSTVQEVERFYQGFNSTVARVYSGGC